MLEAQIAAVAQQFAREAIKLENLKDGSNAPPPELTVKMPSGYADNKSPRSSLPADSGLAPITAPSPPEASAH
jgi:hypothetical protein